MANTVIYRQSMQSEAETNVPIGLITGTNLSAILGQHLRVIEVDTPFGAPSAAFVLTLISNRLIWCLARHGTSSQIKAFDVNYRANVWAFKELGVQSLLATATVGGVNASVEIGDIVIPDQIVDYTFGREHTFAKELEFASIDFTFPFSGTLREALNQALPNESRSSEQPHWTYGCTQGPRLETAAEVNRMRKDGCDLVGMTLMPEAALAREIGLNYAAICLVVNKAAGVGGKTIDIEQIPVMTSSRIPVLRDYLERVLQLIE